MRLLQWSKFRKSGIEVVCVVSAYADGILRLVLIAYGLAARHKLVKFVDQDDYKLRLCPLRLCLAPCGQKAYGREDLGDFFWRISIKMGEQGAGVHLYEARVRVEVGQMN